MRVSKCEKVKPLNGKQHYKIKHNHRCEHKSSHRDNVKHLGVKIKVNFNHHLLFENVMKFNALYAKYLHLIYFYKHLDTKCTAFFSSLAKRVNGSQVQLCSRFINTQNLLNCQRYFKSYKT